MKKAKVISLSEITSSKGDFILVTAVTKDGVKEVFLGDGQRAPKIGEIGFVSTTSRTKAKLLQDGTVGEETRENHHWVSMIDLSDLD